MESDTPFTEAAARARRGELPELTELFEAFTRNQWEDETDEKRAQMYNPHAIVLRRSGREAALDNGILLRPDRPFEVEQRNSKLHTLLRFADQASFPSASTAASSSASSTSSSILSVSSSSLSSASASTPTRHTPLSIPRAATASFLKASDKMPSISELEMMLKAQKGLVKMADKLPDKGAKVFNRIAELERALEYAKAVDAALEESLTEHLQSLNMSTSSPSKPRSSSLVSSPSVPSSPSSSPLATSSSFDLPVPMSISAPEVKSTADVGAKMQVMAALSGHRQRQALSANEYRQVLSVDPELLNQVLSEKRQKDTLARFRARDPPKMIPIQESESLIKTKILNYESSQESGSNMAGEQWKVNGFQLPAEDAGDKEWLDLDDDDDDEEDQDQDLAVGPDDFPPDDDDEEEGEGDDDERGPTLVKRH